MLLATTLLIGSGLSTQAAAGDLPDDLDGIWQSRGYGYILEIEPGRIAVCERTSLNCLLSPDVESLDDLTAAGLVIDLRLMEDGNEYLGIALANRLAYKKRLVFKKRAYTNGKPTRPQKAFIEPHDDPFYHGELAILISPETASGGETLSLALRELPQATLFGMPTNGILSDVLFRTLPSGDEYGLSNENYFSADNEVFEAVGVPPDIELPFFPLSDRQEGVDSILDEAVIWLAQARQHWSNPGWWRDAGSMPPLRPLQIASTGVCLKCLGLGRDGAEPP